MEEGEGGLDAKGNQDELATCAVDAEVFKGERTALAEVDDRPREEQDARCDLDGEVADTGGVGALGVTGPDQEDAGDRRGLPEHEQRDQVSREGGTDGGSGVGEAGDVLDPIVDVERIDHAQESGDVKDIAPHHAQLVDADRVELVVEHGHHDAQIGGQGHQMGQAEDRQEQDPGL